MLCFSLYYCSDGLSEHMMRTFHHFARSQQETARGRIAPNCFLSYTLLLCVVCGHLDSLILSLSSNNTLSYLPSAGFFVKWVLIPVKRVPALSSPLPVHLSCLTPSPHLPSRSLFSPPAHSSALLSLPPRLAQLPRLPPQKSFNQVAMEIWFIIKLWWLFSFTVKTLGFLGLPTTG